MTLEFYEHIKEVEEQEMRQKQQQTRKNSKPFRKPIEIQVIEEMDDEEASVNPYGVGLSPSMMGGLSGEKMNPLEHSLRKLRAKA